MIRDDVDYCEEIACRFLDIDRHLLRQRVTGTQKNGDRYYRGADLLRVGSLMAIEKFTRKMEDIKDDRQ